MKFREGDVEYDETIAAIVIPNLGATCRRGMPVVDGGSGRTVVNGVNRSVRRQNLCRPVNRIFDGLARSASACRFCAGE
ncbi:hypothetical protein KCP75_05515 [Salmonella enterica subsp. enterica]|nr:hypothetical protein KCP75_05515 [Salmonella enterica subsp. enterica]